MQTRIDTIIMGGTFNPVHIGHMHLAEEALKQFNPKRFLIVPSFISAHKQDRRIAAARDRIAMLELACRDSVLEIEKCEVEREGVSYTIDTIRYIREKYKLNGKPGLLIGDDLAEGFSGWKHADLVAEESQLIVAYREHSRLKFDYEHRRIDNLLLNISSSDIRERLGSGKACRYLMPEGVYDYIIENNLYGD